MHTDRIDEAVEKELITQLEGEQLHKLWIAMRNAIRVDDFSESEFKNGQ